MSTQSCRLRASSWEGSSSHPSSSSARVDQHNKPQNSSSPAPGVCIQGVQKHTTSRELQGLLAAYGVSSVRVLETPQYDTNTAFVEFHEADAAQQVGFFMVCVVNFDSSKVCKPCAGPGTLCQANTAMKAYLGQLQWHICTNFKRP